MERGDDASSLNVNGGQRAVYVLRDSRGIKTACTAAAWAPGGDTLMAGGRDGSLQLWEVRAKAYQPVSATRLPPLPHRPF
jgi:WD40 repeat protein